MPTTLLSFLIKVLSILLDFLEMLSPQLGTALKLLTDLVTTLEVQCDFVVLHRNHCSLPQSLEHDSDCSFHCTYPYPCAQDVECLYLSCDCVPAPEIYACMHQQRTMYKIVTFSSTSPRVELHIYCKNSLLCFATFFLCLILGLLPHDFTLVFSAMCRNM